MGEVFRARDPRIGRNVAIKVLPPEVAADAERLRRFEQEARAAGTLNHPNLVTIYDIGDSGGAPYLVMELLDGETLRDRLPASAATLPSMLLSLAEVCDAVAAAHAAGVVHRDLKPENIIVTKSGYAKVLDFGLAKLTIADDSGRTEPRMTEPGMIVGTIDYMSPEQATGKRVDHRSDIFSLGSILYEALTGEVPFHGDSVVTTLHAIVFDDPPPLPATLPAELQRIVGKCLAKNPDERYQSAKDLAVDLRNAAAPSPRARGEGGRRPGEGRLSARLAIAAAIAIAALAVWMATHRAPAALPLRIAPLTTNGNVIDAAVSPDGKYIAYVESSNGTHSLWLRQIGTTQSINIVPPAPVAFWGISFAPDGSTIDYAVKSAGQWSGTLYRVAMLGGPPRRILDGTDSGAAFSRDGARIAWLCAGWPRADESALMVANADGSNVRALAVRKMPQFFVPLFFAMPAWSPDGATIATPLADGATARVALVDARSGALREIGPRWTFAATPSWLSRDALLLVASDAQRWRTQIWRVAVPSGEAQQVTHDLASYRTVDVTADGRTAVAVAGEIRMAIWVNGSGAPVKVAEEQTDGFRGLAAGAARIVFTVTNPNRIDLWSVARDGSNRQPIVTEGGDAELPVLTRDGRTIVYRDTDRGGAFIARADANGGNVRRLAPAAVDSAPSVSPDGRTVYFDAGGALYRVGIDGGTPVVVSRIAPSHASVSPDGRSIAGVVHVTPNDPPTIATIDLATGALLRRLAVPRGATTMSEAHWSADGRYVLFNEGPTISRVPAGGGAVETVASFDTANVFSFDVAPDGALVIARGALMRDAVQLTGF